jgi:hypothetical protein
MMRRMKMNGWWTGGAAALAACALAACGGGSSGGGGGGVDLGAAPLTFEKNRDGGGDIAPVLTESTGGFDEDEIDSPSVVDDAARADRYLLFYEGTDTSASPTDSIGVVTSSEEDFATLTVTRTLAFDPTTNGSGAFTADDGGATDPSVIVDKSVSPSTLGRYKMWYEARSTTGASSIVFCQSANGTAWEGFTVCTGLSSGTASIRIADPSVIKDGATWRMWFERTNEADGSATIGYATSPDGTTWTMRDADGDTGTAAGPVFKPKGSGRFDSFSVGSPSVVKDSAAFTGYAFIMFFEAGDNPAATESKIGMALSQDGLEWDRFTPEVLAPSSDALGVFDTGDIEHPAIVIDDGVAPTSAGYFLLYYAGDSESNATPNRIGLAVGKRN